MKKFILAMTCLVSLTACEKHHGHKNTVVHASDGSYWKQDDSGNWLLFYMLATSNNAYTSTQTTLPQGGTWVKSNTPPSASQLKGATNEKEDGEESEGGEGEGGGDEGSDDAVSDSGGDSGDSGGGSSE